ncbi:N-acetylmuramoyl-L-alanine amidase [Luteococcus sediminum]
MRPASTTVEVDGTPMKVLATLPVTERPLSMAALTWSSATGESLFQVRVRTAEGWQPWQSTEVEPGAQEAGAIKGSDPIFLGEGTAVEARLLASSSSTATVKDPKVSVIDSGTAQGDAEIVSSAAQQRVRAQASTSSAAQPAIVSRAAWGADESWLKINGSSCVPANLDTTIKAAVVHHTAGTNYYSQAEAASVVRGIYAYHVKSLGWCDVGYNFLVDRFGTIYEGRHGGIENPVHGAHATYWNTDTVGVSVMMNSSTARQSDAAMASMADVIAWKLAGNYRDPLSKLTLAGKYIDRITRHGDVMATSCPGTNITAYMPTLRQQVATRMGNWQTPIQRRWTALGGDSGMLGSPRVLERDFNGGRTTSFAEGGIYQTSAGRTFWMGKDIDWYYRSNNAFTQLGWPVADETAGAAAGDRLVRFERGTISLVGGRIVVQTAGAQMGTPVKGSGRQGDLDGDGRADLLSVAADGTITWWPTGAGMRSGAAVKGSRLTGGPFTWVSQMPDVDGDGHTELVARRGDGTLWAWNGRGAGQFDLPRRIGRGWSAMRAINVVPDMTGDGLPEIVGISGQQGLHRYSLGRDLSLVSTEQIGRNWGGVIRLASVGDFRNKGVVDLLAVTKDGALLNYFGTTSGGVHGYRQVGRAWSGYTRVRSIGDLDGDGRWDLTGSRATGPLRAYRNQTGSWARDVPMLDEVSGLGQLA